MSQATRPSTPAMRQRSCVAALAAVVIFAAGCSGSPTTRLNIDAEALRAPVTAALPQWQQWFPGAELAALANHALQQINELLASDSRVRIAEANARIAGAARQLQASASLEANRARRNVDTVSGNVPVTTNSYSLGIDLSWEADLWGKLSLSQRAAVNDWDASLADRQALALSLVANVYRSGFNAAEAAEQRQLNQRNRDIVKNNAEIIERNFSQGTAEALDVRLSRTNLANAENQLLQSAATLAESRRDIRLLLSRRPAVEPAVSLALPISLPTALPALPTNLNVQTIEQRPDLQAARLRLAAAEARYRIAGKNLLPSLRIIGSAGEATREFNELFDIKDLVWNIAGSLTAPLLQGGRLRAEQQRAKAQQDVAVAEYAQAVLVALNEVNLALANERFLAEREQAIASAVAESAEAETLAFSQYSAGLSDILTVLEAQRRVLDAKRSELQLRNLRLQNRINLLLALGGGLSATATSSSETF